MSTYPEGVLKGWRVGNGFVDCGPFTGGGRYVSVLEYKTRKALTDLTVTFEYKMSDEAHFRGSSLTFIANGKMYDYVPVSAERDEAGFVKSSPITIPLASEMTIRFVVSVWGGDSGVIVPQDSEAQLRNIVIVGLSDGESFQEDCPAGMESDTDHCHCVSCAVGTSNNLAGHMCEDCSEGTFASIEGEETCSTCYKGTSSQAFSGSVRCVTSCVFKSADRTYNMTGFAGSVIGPVTSVSTDKQYYLSICDGVMKKGQCNSGADGEANMHICAPGAGSKRMNFGSELEFVDSAQQDSETTVVLKYHTNSRSNDVDACKGREILSTVIFRCDPSVGAGFPTLLPGGDVCAPTFAWTSQYACRVCVDDDYEEILSKCEKGSQRKELYLKESSKCNGPSRVTVEELECTDISLPLGIILGVGGVILILAGVIVFVIWRNRTITVKYSKLLQSTEGDLEAMAEEEADAERERERTEKETQFNTTTATF